VVVGAASGGGGGTHGGGGGGAAFPPPLLYMNLHESAFPVVAKGTVLVRFDAKVLCLRNDLLSYACNWLEAHRMCVTMSFALELKPAVCV
jgi:hypothetical protein